MSAYSVKNAPATGAFQKTLPDNTIRTNKVPDTQKPKLIRITTVPTSLEKLLENQLAFMSGHYQVIAVSSDEEKLKKAGEKQRVPVYCVNLTRQITPIRDLIALWKLYRFFKKEKPQIVHSHTPKAGTIGMLAAWLAGVPNRLHTIAGLPLLEATGKKRWLLNKVEKLTYRCATQVYPNSYGLRNIVIKEGFCKPQKLKVIGKGSTNGINTSYFSPEHFKPEQKIRLREKLGIQKQDFVFVFIGRLVPDKGIHELIAAFAVLYKVYRNFRLLLVGSYEQELYPLNQAVANDIKTNPGIIEAGYQNDVRPYLAIADTLVFPSYREGFPNVVMQAGAMGLPAIVTNINGCNEIIEQGKNGIIIPTKDKQALREAMIRIATEPELYQSLKEQARNAILTRFEQSYIWEELLREYENLKNYKKPIPRPYLRFPQATLRPAD